MSEIITNKSYCIKAMLSRLSLQRKFASSNILISRKNNPNKNNKCVMDSTQTLKEDSTNIANTLTILDNESKQIQSIIGRNKLNPRDQFGTFSKINQPEPIHKGFKQDLWNYEVDVVRIAKERQKTFRERLDDEFAEGRAIQIIEPLRHTVKHALKKAERLKCRENR